MINDIRKIATRATYRYPLFAPTIVSINYEYTTLPVPAPAFTDGTTLYYKESFWTDFTEEERLFIFCHEIMHIVLAHIFRNKGKDREVLNWVEDAIINQFLARDGMPIPATAVNVPDALEYSVEELYEKYYKLKAEIEEFMKQFTFHIDLNTKKGKITDENGNEIEIDFSKESSTDSISASSGMALNQEYDEKKESTNGINEEIESIMRTNKNLRNEMVEEAEKDLREKAYSNNNSFSPGSASLGIELDELEVGFQRNLVDWRKYLNLTSSSGEKRVLYYEIDPDGILQKQYMNADPDETESEIVVDSSGSMDVETLKIVLREVKNILNTGEVKIGFCDTKFSGFKNIYSDRDIDKIRVVGRGGTDFSVMANSFSKNAENKIVITDGCGYFPDGFDDVLWVIIGWYESPYLMSKKGKNLNYVFIDLSDPEIRNKVRNAHTLIQAETTEEIEDETYKVLEKLIS